MECRAGKENSIPAVCNSAEKTEWESGEGEAAVRYKLRVNSGI